MIRGSVREYLTIGHALHQLVGSDVFGMGVIAHYIWKSHLVQTVSTVVTEWLKPMLTSLGSLKSAWSDPRALAILQQLVTKAPELQPV
jgi:heme exporter protein D